MFGNIALADCKWSDVKPTTGGYLYSESCHARVGLTLRDNDDLNIQVTALRKSMELKDLALDKADQRTILWRNESYEQFDRLNKQASMNEYQKTLWFILGIVVTSAAVYGAGQLK